ncbi:4'-phosphopantetheinyl transferase family protein [Caenimonas soli]|jgi:4'-phosphopantetheinyl transferase|uniref:4'-phosphopantetheinyl transferase family protein n=1 Tax=Caenimonas soli TaxID=2735555 RepID=UPI00155527D2|nr:4'-phosphopantetheinyl transferase superfamily protein [Caenimonas soli]NPC57763.1 4'-phosphopantetheinyl transferase superfamily protein [Caenimonas soli]
MAIHSIRQTDVRLTRGQSLALVVHKPVLAAREATRALLDSLLAQLTNRPVASLGLAKTADGKPFLPGPDAIGFNLSHSRRYSLIALTLSGEIGCDIEDRFTADEDVGELCPLVLHPLELEAMDRLAAKERQLAFRRYWVRKEAALKAMGTGFLRDPRHLIVGQDDAQAAWTGQEGGRFNLHNQSIEAGCVAAVASADADCRWYELQA